MLAKAIPNFTAGCYVAFFRHRPDRCVRGVAEEQRSSARRRDPWMRHESPVSRPSALRWMIETVHTQIVLIAVVAFYAAPEFAEPPSPASGDAQVVAQGLV